MKRIPDWMILWGFFLTWYGVWMGLSWLGCALFDWPWALSLGYVGLTLVMLLLGFLLWVTD